jgi:lipopolysaccharide assembly outer membrane protein LptD (OstA)
MKRVVLISSVAVLALAQAPTDRYVMHSAHAEQRLGKAVIHLAGNVETERNEGSPVMHFSADSIVIEADGLRLQLRSMDYDQDTQEIVLHGDVRVRTK